MRQQLLFAAAASFLFACGAASNESPSTTETATDAVTAGQDGYYELASGSAASTYVRAVNGGTMVCANGKTAATCLAHVDFSAIAGPDGVALDADEATSASAVFATGALIIKASFVFETGSDGKKTKVLKASEAWESMAGAEVNSGLYAVRASGATCAAGATCDQFVETKLNATTSHGLLDVDFATDLKLSASAQADAKATITTPGALIRGRNHEVGSKWTLIADEWLVRMTHVASNGPPNNLSADQQTTLLRVIDNACGDSWCDGDYNFKFDTIVCDFSKSSCTMTLDAIGMDDSGNPPTFPRTCTISGVASYDFMVSTTATGYSALTQDGYTAVDACMQTVEASLLGSARLTLLRREVPA